MKIVLIGYMASGKSTIGKQLAKKLYLPFIDLDAYIVEKEKMEISTIFKEKGEIYFRLIEHKYLKEIVASETKFVLSLGGGTPCYADNMKFLNETDVISIYLKASIGLIVERLKKEKSKRPLVANLNDEEMAEFIAKHLFERSYFYAQATHSIAIDTKKINEIVAEIRILAH
ncbi:shikimate kinase [Polaribacter sp.]|uniref:shikimate kinase n=1 Tax=Polaribacter sp. TaxID=1920175 RepID=UPI003EF8D387